MLDVRWRLDAPDGRAPYAQGHIPSAQYVSLDDDLAAHGLPTDGRHPLPHADAFAGAVRSWGLDDGDTVVVYDDWMSYGAARAWWMLRDAGVAARVLDVTRGVVRIQTGYLYHYAFVMLIGAAGLITWFMFGLGGQ